jgi:hypothetical protein
VDSTHFKVHQHANGAKDRHCEPVGTPRGGLNAKVYAACDALLRPCTKIVLTAGNISDFTAAPDVTEALMDCVVVGDIGYDSKWNREQLHSQGCDPCIPSRKNTKVPEQYNEHLYKARPTALGISFNGSRYSAVSPPGMRKPSGCFSQR